MTEQQKIERLATEVMGWGKKHVKDNPELSFQWWSDGEPTFKYWKDVTVGEVDDMVHNSMVPEQADDIHALMWNPLTDWNHWRQVEEKVMEDERLKAWFFADFCDEIETYLQADLPTRVDALLAALDSLKKI